MFSDTVKLFGLILILSGVFGVIIIATYVLAPKLTFAVVTPIEGGLEKYITKHMEKLNSEGNYIVARAMSEIVTKNEEYVQKVRQTAQENEAIAFLGPWIILIGLALYLSGFAEVPLPFISKRKK